MVRKLTPVSLEGMEFDALMDEQKTYSATIPSYPVETGFPVSDTIILEPISIQMTLYISNTPVTWLHRHGNSITRVNVICDLLEKLWFEKKLVKIVTADTIYTDMGITSLTIKKTKEIGYAREVSLSARKVRTTERRTVDIPSYILKSGETKANAGTASTSATSGKSGSTSTGTSATASSGSSSSSSPGSSSGASSGKSGSAAKKSQSILYGAATGLGFL